MPIYIISKWFAKCIVIKFLYKSLKDKIRKNVFRLILSITSHEILQWNGNKDHLTKHFDSQPVAAKLYKGLILSVAIVISQT